MTAFRHRFVGEVGSAFAGLEVGYVGQLNGGAYVPGVTTRVLFTIGVVSLFGGYSHLIHDSGGQAFGEFGMLFKLPLILSRSRM